MRLIRVTCGLALFTLVAGTAVASPQGESAAAAVAKAEPSDSKAEPMICRKLTVSGSRMPKRVCATKVEWEDHSKRSSDSLRDDQDESDRHSIRRPDSF